MHLIESAHTTTSAVSLQEHSRQIPSQTSRRVTTSGVRDSHKDAFRRCKLASHRKAVAFLFSDGHTAFIDS
jgi:hypothetical protein